MLEERIRRRILRRFVRMGAMPAETAAEMLYYCARPAIVLKRLEYLKKMDLVARERVRGCVSSWAACLSKVFVPNIQNP